MKIKTKAHLPFNFLNMAYILKKMFNITLLLSKFSYIHSVILCGNSVAIYVSEKYLKKRFNFLKLFSLTNYNQLLDIYAIDKVSAQKQRFEFQNKYISKINILSFLKFKSTCNSSLFLFLFVDPLLGATPPAALPDEVKSNPIIWIIVVVAGLAITVALTIFEKKKNVNMDEIAPTEKVIEGDLSLEDKARYFKLLKKNLREPLDEMRRSLKQEYGELQHVDNPTSDEILRINQIVTDVAQLTAFDLNNFDFTETELILNLLYQLHDTEGDPELQTALIQNSDVIIHLISQLHLSAYYNSQYWFDQIFVMRYPNQFVPNNPPTPPEPDVPETATGEVPLEGAELSFLLFFCLFLIFSSIYIYQNIYFIKQYIKKNLNHIRDLLDKFSSLR